MRTGPDAPELDAYTNPDGTLSVWCPRCEDFHAHSAEDGSGEAVVRRCTKAHVGYFYTGYIPVVRGEMTEAVESQRREEARRNRSCASCYQGETEHAGTPSIQCRDCYRYTHGGTCYTQHQKRCFDRDHMR